MTRTAVRDEVRTIIATELGVDLERVTPDARLVEDLGAESLDQVEVVMAIEETFGLVISDDVTPQLRRVQDVVDYVLSRPSVAER